MNPPKEILSEGTKVITHTILGNLVEVHRQLGDKLLTALPPPGNRQVSKAYAGCWHHRAVSRIGIIIGYMAGQHADLYWVRHYCNENIQPYTIAPYLCSEFELHDTITKNLFDKEIKRTYEYRMSKEQSARVLAALKRRDDARQAEQGQLLVRQAAWIHK